MYAEASKLLATSTLASNTAQIAMASTKIRPGRPTNLAATATSAHGKIVSKIHGFAPITALQYSALGLPGSGTGTASDELKHALCTPSALNTPTSATRSNGKTTPPGMSSVASFGWPSSWSTTRLLTYPHRPNRFSRIVAGVVVPRGWLRMQR
jgi:hypothetical protein